MRKNVHKFISDVNIRNFRVSALTKLILLINRRCKPECLMVDHAKCTMQSVLNVDKNVKFLSNQTLADLYTAENVMLNEDPREEIDTRLLGANLCS